MLSSEKHDWQAEDDFRTLQRAQEVHDDKKRLNKALAYGKKQRDATVTIIERESRGLRNRSK